MAVKTPSPMEIKGMYVCICSDVTESEIKELIKKHPHVKTVEDVTRLIDVCANCQQCKDHLDKLIKVNV